MKPRLKETQVVFVDPSFNAEQYNEFIQKWLDENPDKANDDSFMPIFSPYVGSATFCPGEESGSDIDTLWINFAVTVDVWPSKPELAELLNFAFYLEDKFEKLEVHYSFDMKRPERTVGRVEPVAAGNP